ncbi:hypothetical protein PG999_006911 [Apiospora kogelbergensis]|uniref:Uncharacterized protein n=1 Tax=Apiospora kogelbergensis TaxID=1337665 RepID=A0AAW0QWT3_9PEZI
MAHLWPLGVESFTRDPSALQHAQEEQQPKGVLQRQTDVGSHVDGERGEEDGAAAELVGGVADQRREDARHDEVGRDGQVDPLDAHAQVGGQRRDGGEVDEAAQRREPAPRTRRRR